MDMIVKYCFVLLVNVCHVFYYDWYKIIVVRMLGFHVCVVAMDIVMTSSVVVYTVLYLSLMILPLKKA